VIANIKTLQFSVQEAGASIVLADLTGNEKDRSVYRTQIDQIFKQVKELKSQTSDNPKQQSYLGNVELALTKWDDRAKELLSSNQPKRAIETADLDLLRKTRDQQNDVNAAIAKVSVEEQQQLFVGPLAILNTFFWVNYAFWGGIALFSIFVGVSTIRLVRGIKIGQQAEEKFRSVVETASEAIITANAKGNIESFNAGAERIFGYTQSEMAGKPLTLLMPERFHEAHKQGMRRYLTTREARVIGKTVELSGLRKDGTEFPVELSLSSWTVSGETFFTGILNDVTERRQVEEQLQRSEEHLRLMIESIVDYAIFMLDPQGKVVSWNAGAQRLKGYTEQEVLGQYFSLFYTQEDMQNGKPQTVLEIVAAQGRVEDEGWRVRKDGSRFWANVIITALHDKQGKIFGFSKITRDLTEQKQAEAEVQLLNSSLEQRAAQLSAANKELEAFTYSIAHDLRAPLRHIQAFSSMLEQELAPQLTPSAKENLQDIIHSAQEMGVMIDDLLGLAGIGRQELNLEVTSLSSLVQEVLKDIRSTTEDRNILWQIGELSYIDCDPGLMKHVLINLFSNAVKYTRPRNPAIIEVVQMTEQGQPVVFIRDNGVGFSMKYADKLFGVFQRLHRREDFEGTGVGLATVQRIIHKHGGRVWAEAELDKGATFFFTLAVPEKTGHE